MRQRWTRRALQQLSEAQDFIARDNLIAARHLAERIADSTLLLLDQPQLGRPGRIRGTREWPVPGTQFLIVYREDRDRWLTILRLIHSKLDWPGGEQRLKR